MDANVINFIENFIRQRSTATLVEFEQVLIALNNVRKYLAEDPRAAEKPQGKIPYPGAVADRED